MLSRKSRIWTDQDDAELLALKSQGLSAQRMAVRLKRTTRAVSVRLALLRSRRVHEQMGEIEERAP